MVVLHMGKAHSSDEVTDCSPATKITLSILVAFFLSNCPDILHLLSDVYKRQDYYTYYEYKKMNGVGTNLKFGVIYRPIPEIRLGAAIHTPTWYNMNYSMATSIYSSFYTSQDPSNGREGYELDVYKRQ